MNVDKLDADCDGTSIRLWLQNGPGLSMVGQGSRNCSVMFLSQHMVCTAAWSLHPDTAVTVLTIGLSLSEMFV
jgi:hypothetical protein